MPTRFARVAHRIPDTQSGTIPKLAFTLVCAFLAAGSAKAVTPLSDPISPERPLFIFPAPGADAPDSLAHADRILSAWQALPETLRPYSVFQLESPVTNQAFWPDRFRDVLRELQFSSVPVIVNIANADPQSIYALAELRPLFEEFTTIRGVHVEGLTFSDYHTFGEMDPIGAPPNVRWLIGAIELASEFGRLIAIELDELHWPRLMSNAWCKPLYDTIRANKANVVALNAQRGPHNIARSSSLIGLWLEGAVDQWGLACSSDWYRDAGFVAPGIFGIAPEDTRAPPSLYRAMILNGAMTGATAYRFDRQEDLWFGARPHYWTEAILPTLTEVLDRGYIARKDLVLTKAQIAYRLNPSSTPQEFQANLDDIDAVLGQGRMLLGAYGMERPGQIPELVPNTGRYYWIPILSPYALDDTLRNFEEVILPGAMLDSLSWKLRLDSYYQPDGEGTAFISRIGRGIFVLHTRENLFEEQTYRLDALPAPVRQISGQRRTEGVALSWPFREGDLFYRVYRRLLPETEFTLLANDIDGRRYLDATAPSGATVAYSVTALTNEREPHSGTVNYGDYLVFNSGESRIAEEVLLDSITVSALSTPIPPSVDERLKTQAWWPTGLEELESNEASAARAIVARIEAWEQAFVTEQLDGVMELYAENFDDGAGHGRERIETVYDLFFRLYRAGQVHRQIRDWDFSDYTLNGEVSLVLYLRLTGSGEPDPAGRGTGRLVSFPKASNAEVRLTFANRENMWRLLRSDPALPGLDDILPR